MFNLVIENFKMIVLFVMIGSTIIMARITPRRECQIATGEPSVGLSKLAPAKPLGSR